MNRKQSVREFVLQTLNRVDEGEAYANLESHAVLEHASLSSRDAGLYTELVYGTIQRQNTLDYYIQQFVVAKQWRKMESWVRNLVRMSIYQLQYLNKIPAHAVINEAVELAKRYGHPGTASFVNAVLRNVTRHPERLAIPDTLPKSERIALETSHPTWMIECWLEQYGEAETYRIAEANLRRAHQHVRVNLLRTTREEVATQLEQEGFTVEPSPYLPEGLRILRGGSVARSTSFRQGYCTIQDENAMLVAQLLQPLPGSKVLDACAAPGGKTGHLAELMENRGEVIAVDLHPHKRQLIAEQMERLQLTIVQPHAGDVRTMLKELDQTFDFILLDAPCSGLGVLRRKPEIKWRKQEEEILQLAQLQLELLEAVANYLKPGGFLVYSTCTIMPQENEAVVAQFLNSHENFKGVPPTSMVFKDLPACSDAKLGSLLVLPYLTDGDGFFMARIQRRG
ncbi:16S rRNA (cytosine(967)-C(5))-methyltransferase RsmB [Rubeoparvulum massiliense]|uniref:16S rRNA (cytosine(967)-C(5))-methyltransferase RsmB n=1 Tax=Rubeoparvulum massiliense TaxID=1631346 RepID=UPI00065DFB25|nr:16S rRNA (cytosine(967)-C(5))-methyltransferase RsmB [Rubeoparvulum massiliense]